VLLRYPDQTTAVDIWSAGVIFLSLLSGRYPFFKSADDLSALAQIIAVFGSRAVQVAAQAYGKNVLTNAQVEPTDLRMLCEKLKTGQIATLPPGNTSDPQQSVRRWTVSPESAYNLLGRLLDLNPLTRVTADQALEHQFFSEQF